MVNPRCNGLRNGLHVDVCRVQFQVEYITKSSTRGMRSKRGNHTFGNKSRLCVATNSSAKFRSIDYRTRHRRTNHE